MKLAEFYPTPEALCQKMLQDVELRQINTVLEPSAGTGNLIEAFNKKIYAPRADVDAIEIEAELRHILKGKKCRVIHDDFLTLDTLKRYDLILMNPPFSNGDEHLLKALKIQENGGQIVCLLNAETLKNPCTNKRAYLVRRLEALNADIEYLQGEFASAERKTSVEVALIKVSIPKKYDGIILKELELSKAKEQSEKIRQEKSVVHGDFITSIVEQFNYEAKIGVSLIKEYESMQSFIFDSIERRFTQPIIKLAVDDNDDDLINGFLKKIRHKYWEALFRSRQFTKMLTSNLQEDLRSRVNEFVDYDFSLYNIMALRAEMHKYTLTALENTILNLFDELSSRHHYAEYSKNVHYYDGWKTNKCWKINKRIIIPWMPAFSEFSGKFTPDYKARSKLADIEKVFNYLDNGLTDHINLNKALDAAKASCQTSKIRTKYFLITFYKKGTCHLEFLNMDLLHKFNLYGSQRKGWLPPSYGKKTYEEMDAEEKTVVNSFEGKESYCKTIQNKDYFIIEGNKLLLNMPGVT